MDAFPELMARLRAGDPDAARVVYDKWTRRLIGLARARLGSAAIAREDPEDVVQSVYRSFFRRFGEGNYHAEDWHDVWALLSVIALRKCSNRRQFHGSGRRDRKRETTLELDALPALEPGPEDAACLAETVENLLRGLEPPERAIVDLSLQGHTTAEISTRLGRAERSVQRVREHVRKQLQQWKER